MGIRIYNRSINSSLMGKYWNGEEPLLGIRRDANGGKDSRSICGCGWVGKSDETVCPICGNDSFIPVSGNRWYYDSTINVATRDYRFVNHGDTVDVVCDILTSVDETYTKSFNFAEKNFIVGVISDKQIKTNSPSASISPPSFWDWLKANLDNLPNDDFKERIALAAELANILYGKDSDYTYRVYPLTSYLSSRYVFTVENVKKYNAFWRQAVDRISWEDVPAVPTQMPDLLEAIGIPREFDNYCQTSFFNFGSYGKFYSKFGNMKVNDFRRMPTELQKTVISCVEHNIFSLNTVHDIMNWSGLASDEDKLILAKYLKKNGIAYLDRVFSRFKADIDNANTYRLPHEDVLSYKKLAFAQAQQLLETRKFPDSRIDAFLNVFDTDPTMGLKLLTSKAKLKPEEAKKIYG